MQFICRLGTPEGRIIEETFEATDERQLRQNLSKEGFHLFEVRRGGLVGRLPILVKSGGPRRVGLKELQLFNQELAALLKSGLPLLQALDLMLARQRDPRFRQTLTEIRDKVKSGESLSTAVESFGDMFPPLFAATIRAGESSGELETVIRRFVRYLGLILETKKKVTSALVYPIALISLAAVLIGVMMVYVLPQFTDFFSAMSVDLPLLTRLTMGMALFVKGNLWLILIGLVAATIAWLQFSRSEAGRTAIARLILKVPFLGQIFHRLALSEFCRSLATLLAGGIPLVSALEVSVRAVSNRHLREQLKPVSQSVREGGSLAETLKNTGAASEILIDMVEVGEATGALDSMLSDVSDFLDDEVDTQLQRLLSLLEPIMLVLMGVIVATLLISVYLPLFSLLGRVQG